jgi:hypothetical protein
MSGLIAREEPQAGWNLRIQEELRRERDHALHHVALHHPSPNLALVVLVGTH